MRVHVCVYVGGARVNHTRVFRKTEDACMIPPLLIGCLWALMG